MLECLYVYMYVLYVYTYMYKWFHLTDRNPNRKEMIVFLRYDRYNSNAVRDFRARLFLNKSESSIDGRVEKLIQM